MKKFMEPTQ
uniref:Uncharacterized protein n=1 Tax=Rhizophora mucronata TaxID=61149 RepID=A0A2P2M5I8_RHIMU